MLATLVVWFSQTAVLVSAGLFGWRGLDALLRTWEYSAFNVNAAVRIDADDAAGRENLAPYLIRAPFSRTRSATTPPRRP